MTYNNNDLNKLKSTAILGGAVKALSDKTLQNKWIKTDYWKPSLIMHGTKPSGYSTDDYNVANSTSTGSPKSVVDVDGSYNNESVFMPSSGTGDPVDLAIQIAEQNKKDGSWKRSHKGSNRNGAPNPNLVQMWTDLGLRSFTQNGTTDNTPWCAGFLYWCLVRSGYPIPSSNVVASAKWIAQGGHAKLGYKMINASEAKRGDIAVWKWSHVNFIIDVEGDKFVCVGGNQTDNTGKSLYNNNPSNSGVTINRVSKSSLLTGKVYRPQR